MKAVTKITFYDEQDEKFFGEGPCRLLHAIEAEGSLRAAASSMGLAYSKALRMIKKCRACTRISTHKQDCRWQIRRWKHSDTGRKGMDRKI